MRITVQNGRCSGCRLCRQVCAIENFGGINPSKAAIRIEARFPRPGTYTPHVCIQCGACATACPVEAISQNGAGAHIVDKDKCTNCGACVAACPQGVVFQHPGVDHVIICTFCMQCTTVCNTGAIVPSDTSEKASGKEARHG